VHRIISAVLVFLTVLSSCSETENDQVASTKNKSFEKAILLLENGQLDSAFYYFELAKEGYLLEQDSLNVARSLIEMGIIQYERGDFFGAQEISLEATKYVHSKDRKQHHLLSYIYNTVANATDELHLYEQAIPYYHLAIQYSSDPANIQLYKNNLAVCFRNAKQYSASIEMLQDLLTEYPKGSRSYAMVLNNLAKARWALSNSYNPIALYQEALSIRIKENDIWGINSSYATLSTYYQKSNIDSSIYYLDKQYEVAQQIQSKEEQLKILRKFIQLDSDYAERYLPRYLQLNDSIQNARMIAKNQFALIRYESEKNKSKSLLLERENERKETHLFRQRIGIGFLIVWIVSFSCFGLLWYKKRKQRIVLEAQNHIQENQLKLSKTIHDVVANGIYRVMTEVEYTDYIDQEKILDKLDELYQKSRDISHRVEYEASNIPFHEELAELLKSFATEKRRILIAGNEAEFWDALNPTEQNEINQVLLELMVNMKKHSQASQVVIRFIMHHDRREIIYKDNGIGIKTVQFSGKGLANTVSRMNSIAAEIIFVTEEGKGLKVKMTIPKL